LHFHWDYGVTKSASVPLEEGLEPIREPKIAQSRTSACRIDGHDFVPSPAKARRRWSKSRRRTKREGACPILCEQCGSAKTYHFFPNSITPFGFGANLLSFLEVCLSPLIMIMRSALLVSLHCTPYFRFLPSLQAFARGFCRRGHERETSLKARRRTQRYILKRVVHESGNREWPKNSPPCGPVLVPFATLTTIKRWRLQGVPNLELQQPDSGQPCL
jgi:hypothetical protein